MTLFGRTVCLVLFIITVSASVTEKILTIPLFEVGEIWINSIYRLHSRVMDVVMAILDVHSYLFYIALPVILYLGYHLYHLLFTPLNRVRVLGDLGYLPDGNFSKKEIANNVKQRRIVGNIPPVYPNGWFGLIESWKLKKGESVNLAMLGEQLAVFRDEKGEAHSLDAHCPHLGANIAVGGRVIGDCLECPFHGWKFRGKDGMVTHIPYADKVPEGAKIRAWPTAEINGWIYIWYHAEGLDPTWTIPEVENITSGQWSYSGRTEHFINVHIQDVAENVADSVHFQFVHVPFIGAGFDLTTMRNKLFSFAFHKIKVDWSQHPAPEEHIGSAIFQHELEVFGFNSKFMCISFIARQIGPGIVHLHIDTIFGKGICIMSYIPVEPMVQKFVGNLYLPWSFPTIVSNFFLIGEAIQLERDIAIWNNKKYEGKPYFVRSKEDTLIARHRRWYSQFYSENSPKLTFRKEGLDW